jgi:hypothetical protein
VYGALLPRGRPTFDTRAPRSSVLRETWYPKIQTLRNPSGPIVAGKVKARAWCRKGAAATVMKRYGDVLAEFEPGPSLAEQGVARSSRREARI